VIDLQKLPNNTVTVGYIYGGIAADFPLPKIPNQGTAATANIYQVLLTPTSSSGYIPSSSGTLANGVLTPSSLKAG
jgi:hypothetical protein